MTARGIGVGVHYRSVTSYSFYQERFGWRSEDYPNARQIGDETLSIPFSAKLDDSEIARVIGAVRAIAGQAASR
jgi:dTDP-4-amino-4,6-dideoxygalactose transaminase